MRRFILTVIAVFFATAAAAQTYGGWPTYDTTATNFPDTTPYPNPYVIGDVSSHMSGGTAVTTAAQWATRRTELMNIFGYYFFGHAPPLTGVTVTATSGPTDTVIGTMTQRRVNLQLNYSGHTLAFLINMYMPNSSTPHPFANGVPNTGPYPILIFGEEGWCTLISYNRQCAPTSQAGLQALVNRGYIIAEVNRDPFSLDPDGDGTYAQIYGCQLAACIYTMWPWDGNGVTGYDWTAIYARAWATAARSTTWRRCATSTRITSASSASRAAPSPLPQRDGLADATLPA